MVFVSGMNIQCFSSAMRESLKCQTIMLLFDETLAVPVISTKTVPDDWYNLPIEEEHAERIIVDGGANNNYCVKGVSAVVLGTLIFLEGVFRLAPVFKLVAFFIEICLLREVCDSSQGQRLNVFRKIIFVFSKSKVNRKNLCYIKYFYICSVESKKGRVKFPQGTQGPT